MKRLLTTLAFASLMCPALLAEDQGRPDARDSRVLPTLPAEVNQREVPAPAPAAPELSPQDQRDHRSVSDAKEVTKPVVKKSRGFLKPLAHSTLAILSFVFGLLALVSYYGAFLFGVLAIVLGIIALSQVGAGEPGHTLAVLGIIFGIIGLIIWPVVIFVVI